MIDTARNNLNINNVSEAIDAQYKYTTLPIRGAASGAMGTNSLSGAISGVNNVGLNGADRLIVRSLGAMPGVKLIADMVNDTDALQINASEAGVFQQGDIVLVTNCIYADIFQITNNPSSGVLNHQTGSSETPDNGRSDLSFTYKKANSKVYHLSGDLGLPYVAYDIADSGTPAIPGLAKAGQQLVPDIENMQIEFGQSMPGGVIAYVAPGTAGLDMNNVMGIKISLLVRSQDDFVATSPQPYFFNNTQVSGAAIPDRRLRKVYTSTISTRNRLN
jgi:type IV pilus assembly protein PilW